MTSVRYLHRLRGRPFTSSPWGGGGARAIFASEMVRIGEDEVGGSAAKPLNFIGKVLLQRRSRRGGGVKNDNLVRIGEEGGQAEFLVS